MGIDGDDRVIGPEKLHRSPHTRVAAVEVPNEEVQGRLIATGTELEKRPRRVPVCMAIFGESCRIVSAPNRITLLIVQGFDRLGKAVFRAILRRPWAMRRSWCDKENRV
jgi:hypothetical protein